jgi:hypothetical protein
MIPLEEFFIPNELFEGLKQAQQYLIEPGQVFSAYNQDGSLLLLDQTHWEGETKTRAVQVELIRVQDALVVVRYLDPKYSYEERYAIAEYGNEWIFKRCY